MTHQPESPASFIFEHRLTLAPVVAEDEDSFAVVLVVRRGIASREDADREAATLRQRVEDVKFKALQERGWEFMFRQKVAFLDRKRAAQEFTTQVTAGRRR